MLIDLQRIHLPYWRFPRRVAPRNDIPSVQCVYCYNAAALYSGPSYDVGPYVVGVATPGKTKKSALSGGFSLVF